MSVDPLFAQWLQEEAQWIVRESAALKARWGDSAVVAERVTAIASSADAAVEADRQLAFLAGPLAQDVHVVATGAQGWSRHLGQVITLTGDGLGYEVGLNVFLLSVEDDYATGLSTLIVLRQL